VARTFDITLTHPETAKDAAEWAEYHHDTYGFEVVRASGMTVTVRPLGDEGEFVAMLREDGVSFRRRRVAARYRRAS
jgi:hypothetical protein